jgi:2-methylisocitrate lyase-like PEP mutase family enzyme
MTDTAALAAKVAAFRALHENPGAFVIPNPWDIGSARILAGLGFAALATTSAGAAFAMGLLDGALGRDAILANAGAIAAATDLPVNADLENCFADAPDAAADSIRRAAAAGLAGGSIEDADASLAIYPFDQAVERVAAAVEAARRAPAGFVLTARAENFLRGRPDLDDTIRRLQAFEKAGADVLYAPGLPDFDAIRTVCAAVSRPVNVLANTRIPGLSVAVLADLGAKRISLGGTLSRTILGSLVRAATELRDHGTFGFAADALPMADIAAFLQPPG